MENELAQYGPFLKEIKELIYRHQYEAMKRVNSELIRLYWEIGENITQRQNEKGWGKSVVEILAKELQKEFPGVHGFSARNLWLMRSFYTEYSQNVILQPLVAELEHSMLPPLVAEISWTKNIVIMQKFKDPIEREFYIKMTKRYGWTKDVLYLIICVLCSHRRTKSRLSFMNFEAMTMNKNLTQRCGGTGA